MQITDRDRVVAALTIMGEATRDHDADRLAVACVILNRAANPRRAWGGGSVADVCLHRNKPSRWHQFSCWNADERHNERWRAVVNGAPLTPTGRLLLAPFLDVFDRAVKGERPRADFGATHYARADWVKAGRVSWMPSRSFARATIIGAHAYFEPQHLDTPEARIRPYVPAPAPVVAPEPAARPEPAPRPWWAVLLNLLARIFGGRK